MKTAAERLWSRMTRTSSGCWEYAGSRDAKNYGRIRVKAGTWHTVRAHRLAWMLHNQEDVPDGLMICHKCDNPPCCNPWHLYAGTASDNQQDRKNWGTGDRANRTILTDAQVRELRSRYVRYSEPGSGTSSVELAAEYGITVGYMIRLIRGATPRKVREAA